MLSIGDHSCSAHWRNTNWNHLMSTFADAVIYCQMSDWLNDVDASHSASHNFYSHKKINHVLMRKSRARLLSTPPKFTAALCMHALRCFHMFCITSLSICVCVCVLCIFNKRKEKKNKIWIFSRTQTRPNSYLVWYATKAVSYTLYTYILLSKVRHSHTYSHTRNTHNNR